MKFYTDIDELAIKKGGRVISLLGNHELMNVTGNMKYVSYKGLMEFAEEGDNVEEAMEKRKNSFSNKVELDGLNKFLACTRTSSIIVGNLLFVHGGLMKEMANEYKLTDINIIVRKWLLGKLHGEIAKKLLKVDKQANIVDKIKKIISSSSSIFWNRFLGYLPSDNTITTSNKQQFTEQCDKYLEPVFSTYNLKGRTYGKVGYTRRVWCYNRKNCYKRGSITGWRISPDCTCMDYK